MRLAIYSFAKAGNYFVARTLLHAVEGNLYHCLQTHKITDLHNRALEADPLLKSQYEEAFGPPRPTPLATGDDIIIKTHTLAGLEKVADEIEGIIVPLRAPTDIVKSHVAFQYLEVNALEGSFNDHALWVYNDQRRFFEQFFTMRPCLEVGHESYVEVIFNALNSGKPVLFCHYNTLVRDPAGFARLVYKTFRNRDVVLPPEFAQEMSKKSFVSVQEDIIDFYMQHRETPWIGGLLRNGGPCRLSRWAYNKGFRVVNPHAILAEMLRNQPPCERGDELYKGLQTVIPPDGMFLADTSECNRFKGYLLDRFAGWFKDGVQAPQS